MRWLRGQAAWRVIIAGNAVVFVALLALVGARLAPALRMALSQPAQSAIAISGPGVETATTITAYILGDVAMPGVYTLSAGARVQDLVAAAGGAGSDADMTQVDLAARVSDGQEVYVPRVGEKIPLTLGGKVDINVASANDLHNALGIQLATARRIVAYRAAHGSFTAVSQLLLVPISRATYDHIKTLVTV